MTTPITPPSPETEARPVNAGQWVKGQSGNPSGRPRNLLDTRSKITKVLMEDAAAIARMVSDLALAGDVGCASIVLSRCAPALRAQDDTVQFDFDPTASMARQIEQVLEAMASGLIPPDVAKQITEAIATLSNARATEELAARIEALEAKEAKQP